MGIIFLAMVLDEITIMVGEMTQINNESWLEHFPNSLKTDFNNVSLYFVIIFLHLRSVTKYLRQYPSFPQFLPRIEHSVCPLFSYFDPFLGPKQGILGQGWA